MTSMMFFAAALIAEASLCTRANLTEVEIGKDEQGAIVSGFSIDSGCTSLSIERVNEMETMKLGDLLASERWPSTLRALELHDEPTLGKQGIDMLIARGLALTTALKELSITCSPPGGEAQGEKLGGFGGTRFARALRAESGAPQAVRGGGGAGGLEVLRLNGCGLGDDGAMFLAEALQPGEAPSLRVLELRRNGIGDEGALSIAGALSVGRCAPMEGLEKAIKAEASSPRGKGAPGRAAATLVELDLSQNDIELAAGVLAHTVSLAPSLRALRLLGNRLRASGAARIAEAMGERNHLAMDDDDAPEPMHSLVQCAPDGDAKNQSSGGAGAGADGGRGGEAGAAGAAEDEEEACDLSGRGLTAADLRLLAASAAWGSDAEPALKRLRLRANGFKSSAALALAALLKGAPQLTELDLSANALGSQVALSALSEALSRHAPSLAALDLGGNGMADGAATLLCDALLAPGAAPRLRSLGLDDNALTDAGAAPALVRLARQKKGLRTLSVARNEALTTCAGRGVACWEWAASAPAKDGEGKAEL